jgi:archaemetzincin
VGSKLAAVCSFCAGVRSRRSLPLASLAFWLAVASGWAAEPGRPQIAIQPFSGFDPALVGVVREAIASFFAADVEVLSPIPLPDTAFYAPRKRYRADKLLEFLESAAEPRFAKVVGLAPRDISTTKGKVSDWGIFGLGNLGGRACVVSTWRLGRGKVAEAWFRERLVKVVCHEVGHTFGLEHCPNRGCLMEDAGGAIKTVDQERLEMCAECRKRLGPLLQPARDAEPKR